MEGHRLGIIGAREREARINKSANRKKKNKVRPVRIIGPTLVVKDTDNYTIAAETPNGIQGNSHEVWQMHVTTSPRLKSRVTVARC